jgi:hypothetical protein
MLREVNIYSVIILLGQVSVYMKMYWTVITKRATLYIFVALVTSEWLRCTGFAGLQRARAILLKSNFFPKMFFVRAVINARTP